MPGRAPIRPTTSAGECSAVPLDPPAPSPTPIPTRRAPVARLPDAVYILSPTLHILSAKSRRGLAWVLDDAQMVGRWLADAAPPGLRVLYIDHIDLARRYRREIPMTYWWERDGTIHERIARIRVHPDDTIEVRVEHLGTRPGRSDTSCVQD